MCYRASEFVQSDVVWWLDKSETLWWLGCYLLNTHTHIIYIGILVRSGVSAMFLNQVWYGVPK